MVSETLVDTRGFDSGFGTGGSHCDWFSFNPVTDGATAAPPASPPLEGS